MSRYQIRTTKFVAEIPPVSRSSAAGILESPSPTTVATGSARYAPLARAVGRKALYMAAPTSSSFKVPPQMVLTMTPRRRAICARTRVIGVGCADAIRFVPVRRADNDPEPIAATPASGWGRIWRRAGLRNPAVFGKPQRLVWTTHEPTLDTA